MNTKREVRRSIGLPGTGLSHTTQTKLDRSDDLEEVRLEELTVDELAYLKGRQLRKLVALGSAAVIVILIFAGALTVAGYLIIPAVVLTIAAPWFARWL